MNGALFVLSGEDLTLPFAEIRALVETYSPASQCEKLGRRIVIADVESDENLRRISERAAYCRFGGRLVSKASTLAELVNDNLPGFKQGITYAVASETLDRDLCGDLGALIKERTKAKVSLEEPNLLFQVEKAGDSLVLGVSNHGYKQFSWRERRPRGRKFFLPSAIYPKFARLLVNLSRVREGEYFLDPFCGTGSLLLESSLMGARTIGIDLTKWIAKGAKLNLKGFALDFESVIRADSTHYLMPFRYIDAIATDVPYGRASSTRGKETGKIIEEFTTAASNMLNSSSNKRRKYCVLMHPSHVELRYDSKSFELSEQHLVYVHRNLTRAISVLRRV